jgi:glycosyltransferase involved in cell wall biosynthesis
MQIGMLVLPSLAEGFGLVLIEAMAAGVPVVATDAPGIRDVVVHERTGLLVPVAAPEALAGAIARLIDDAALRRRLIDNALREVRGRFAWPAVLRQYRDVLKLGS